ncbi:MAG: hypothetical protein HZB70_00330 [Candidatus Berkelbacteria bacterium]|nr:MAG: hypothetical protein HZB70_00330 [Candidatus Berkelbacteria bacterium]QQG51446.1 MAG: hypothetical protein HY845_02670 [Candidatus Berkelbacteria bacterium]
MLRLFVVLAALVMGVAPTTFAATQQAQHTLGVQWLGKTEERLRQSVSMSFNASAYDTGGTREDNLGGSYSAITGYYPQVPRGTVLDLRIIARGFKRIERVWICVGESANGKDSKDERSGIWDYQGYRYRLCRTTEFPGEFSYLFDTDQSPLRPIPLQWIVEHRDDRDRYQVAIFTFTWTRGGMMTGSLEINILRGPADYRQLRGTEILRFLKGFLPIDATPDNNGGTSTVIPGQESTQRIGGSKTAGGEEDLPYRGSTQNRDNGQTANRTDIGVGTALFLDEPKFANEAILGDDELQLAAKGRVTGREISTKPNGWNVIYVLSSKPFEAKLIKDGRADFQLAVRKRQDGIHWVRVWARANTMIGATLAITQDGQRISYAIARSK